MATLANATSWWVAAKNSSGDLIDQGANGRTMVDVNGPAILDDGSHYYAELRAASSEAFGAADANDLDADGGDFTVLIVLTPRVNLTGEKALWAKYDEAANTGIKLRTQGATPWGSVGTGAGSVTATGSNLSVGTQYSLAMVRASGQLRVVVNGTAGSNAASSATATNTQEARIGRLNSSSNYTDADIYGVAWFKGTALTNSECTAVGTELLAADVLVTPVGKDLDLRWNVQSSVGKDLDLRWTVAGPVGKNLDLRWSVAGPVGAFQVRTEVAWDVDPLTRPDEVDDWTDFGTRGIRDLNIRRGTKVLSSSVEAGTAACKADNSDRELDPSNQDSSLWPNVKPRKRIRFIVDTPGGEVTLFTGFVERWPIEWMLETGWVTISASDLVNIIAGLRLPPSVLDVFTRELGPRNYWPMAETVFTAQADDVVGTADGAYLGPVATGSQVDPYDSRSAPKFAKPGVDADIDCTAMVVNPFTPTDEFSVSVWFKWEISEWDDSRPTIIMLTSVYPPTTAPPGDPHNPSPARISLYFHEADGLPGRHETWMRIQDGTNLNRRRVAVGHRILDGQPHHILFTGDCSTKTFTAFVDGVGGSLLDASDPDDDDISTINASSVMSSVETLAVGWGIDWQATFGPANAAVIGRVAYFDSQLDVFDAIDIYDTGVESWDGDTTGERLDKILDLVGIDAGDRDIATGTQVCGPTTLGSQNTLAYIKKLVATEQGVCFVSGDGKLTFTDRLPDSPTIVQVFSDDLTADPTGVPVGPVRPDFSWDRIINTLNVGRENGTEQPVVNQTSVDAYGPLSGATGGKLDTLHQDATDARATGERLVERYANPRTYIPAVTLEASDDSVTLDALTAVELGDATTTKVRPAGGGDPIEQTAIVEAVEHRLPGANVWETSYSLVDYPLEP